MLANIYSKTGARSTAWRRSEQRKRLGHFFYLCWGRRVSQSGREAYAPRRETPVRGPASLAPRRGGAGVLVGLAGRRVVLRAPGQLQQVAVRVVDPVRGRQLHLHAHTPTRNQSRALESRTCNFSSCKCKEYLYLLCSLHNAEQFLNKLFVVWFFKLKRAKIKNHTRYKETILGTMNYTEFRW